MSIIIIIIIIIIITLSWSDKHEYYGVRHIRVYSNAYFQKNEVLHTFKQ